ncbi:IS66 family insertion sequence element accessory protein TnpA [Faecalibacillus faecis]
MIRNKEQWKKAIENQKSSGLTIKDYCMNNHICISSFYKQKALL